MANARQVGIDLSFPFVEMLLPMGISFYTFQSMSYTIDVYRKKIEPCDSWVDFFLYLSFFSQLVAGPIVRAKEFLPQINDKARGATASIEKGLYRILRGFFLKVVIADNISQSVEFVFSSVDGGIGIIQAWIGALAFAVQIFCDFAGYSDIAIGTALLFGFKINENFLNPYLATSMKDFWGRWHISLSSWFRDYLYLPLGGNRIGPKRTVFNIFCVFLLSGLWHGANMTFVLWGLIHFLGYFTEKYFIPAKVLDSKSTAAISFRYIITMLFVLFAWVTFRAESLSHALAYWQSMLMFDGFSLARVKVALLIIGLFGVYQFFMMFKENGKVVDTPQVRRVEMVSYLIFVLLFAGQTSDFIYFQF